MATGLWVVQHLLRYRHYSHGVQHMCNSVWILRWFRSASVCTETVANRIWKLSVELLAFSMNSLKRTRPTGVYLRLRYELFSTRNYQRSGNPRVIGTVSMGDERVDPFPVRGRRLGVGRMNLSWWSYCRFFVERQRLFRTRQFGEELGACRHSVHMVGTSSSLAVTCGDDFHEL